MQFEDTRFWQDARPADDSQYVVTIKPADAIGEAERASWAQLTARAGSANIFAHAWFMASALRHCGPRRVGGVRLAIVRALDGKWLGVLPLTLEAMTRRCPLPVWHSWLATNQFVGTPLIERGAEHLFWHCLLTQLDRAPGMGLALCCEQLPLDDPATAALVEVCLAQGRLYHRSDLISRPMLMRRDLDATAATARRKLDKRLDSLERKLRREVGELKISRLAAHADCAAWIEQFLALEKSGWKGSTASALGCDPGTAGLFREVIRIAHQKGEAGLMRLEVAGQVIAMTSWFVRGRHGYGFKMAYDEAFRTYAPGRLLMRAVAAEIEGSPIVLFDSCARADAPPDPLWPQTRQLANYVVSIGAPARRTVFAGVMRARHEAARLAARRLSGETRP